MRKKLAENQRTKIFCQFSFLKSRKCRSITYSGDFATLPIGNKQIEKHHEERYRALLKNIETAQVFEKSEVKVWECRNCGHVVVGTKAPEICPVCNHPQSYFEIREENY